MIIEVLSKISAASPKNNCPKPERTFDLSIVPITSV